MKKSEIEDIRDQLLQLKTTITNSGILKSNEDLTVSSDDLPDEADLATSVINQQVTFNLRSRELNKLRLVEAALQRINDGIYGYCLDCEEQIGTTRLKHQPWASLCIIHAEERERASNNFSNSI